MKSENIQGISDNYLCSACGACYAVCNKDAISYRWSSVGRKYAQIDTDKCINCSLCLKVCPSVDILNLHSRYDDMYVGNIINTYTGRAADDKIFKNAQSGGICTAITKYLFEQKKIDCAVMCQMTAEKTPQIKAVVIENVEQLYSCQKSCYTFVDVLSALKLTKHKQSVAVVGVPCHIEGATLLSEQFIQFSNIKYKIGLICDRTQCKGMQDVLVSLIPKGKSIIQWRKKDFEYEGNVYNYRNAPCVVLDENLNIKKKGIFPNAYRFILKDIFTTPRCRVCYDKLNTHADIVLGDPWGMSDIDWQHGESLVLTRTELGEAIIREMTKANKISLKRRTDYFEVIFGQHIETKPKERETYIAAYNSLFQCNDSYIPHSGKDELRSQTYEQEFKMFLYRESLTIKDIQKEARQLLKSVTPRKQPIHNLLRKIKKTLINHLISLMNLFDIKIVLDGVETNNKGAELMFYAILQEIEHKYPNATIYINQLRVKQGFSYIQTSLKLKDIPIRTFEKKCIKLHLWRVMKKILGNDIYQDIHCYPGVKYYIDDSGFFYGDQWNLPADIIERRRKLLASHKRWGSKVVFLPQAFGPLTQDNLKQGISDLNKYADIVMPREKTSCKYLVDSGLVDKTKIRLYPDFTCLVKGKIPQGYEHLHNGVCIIPNVRMLDKIELTFKNYNDFIQTIIQISIEEGYTPYLLNHEGKDDSDLARKFQSMSSYNIEVVDNLNALEVKGIISTAHLVVTSRFHGAASSLNSCVPCLATSWSHKYEELFKDYHQTNCILSVKDCNSTKCKVQEYLDDNNNNEIREQLRSLQPEMIEKSKAMWNDIWNL